LRRPPRGGRLRGRALRGRDQGRAGDAGAALPRVGVNDMAASKSRPPEVPAGTPKLSGKLPAAAPELGGAAVPAGPRKVRAGMGDVEAELVEVWTDEDHRRATGLLRVLDEQGQADPAAVPSIDPARLVEIYRAMVRIRTIDERLMAMQRQGRIGFYAEARGQEAAVIGGVAALEADDFVVPAHRELGAALYRGLPLRAF